MGRPCATKSCDHLSTPRLVKLEELWNSQDIGRSASKAGNANPFPYPHFKPAPPGVCWRTFSHPSMCKGYHQEVAHTRWAIKAIKAIHQKSEKWLQSEDGFECVPNWRSTLEAVDRSAALIVRVKSHGDLCPTSVLPKIRVGLDHHFGIFLGRHQILNFKATVKRFLSPVPAGEVCLG